MIICRLAVNFGLQIAKQNALYTVSNPEIALQKLLYGVPPERI